MLSRKPAVVIFVLLLFFPRGDALKKKDDDYVNPFDIMNFDPVPVKMKNAADSTTDKVDDTESKSTQQAENIRDVGQSGSSKTTQADKLDLCNCPSVDTSCVSVLPLFRQYLKQLVNILEPKVGHIKSYDNICLRLHVSAHDLYVIRNYGKGTSSDIHAVHETLSHMMQEAKEMSLVMQEAKEVNHIWARIYWLEDRLGISTENMGHVSIIIVSTVVLTRTVTRLSLKWNLLLIYGTSVIFTWLEMYQKECANQEKMYSAKSHCSNLESLPWYSRMGLFVSSSVTFQDEECRQFYESMVVNPFFKVSPIEACAVVLVKTVMTPLGIVGIGIKKFLVGLLKDMPIQFQMSVILFLAVFLILLVILLNRYTISVPWLLTIGPRQNMSHIQSHEPNLPQTHIDYRSHQSTPHHLTDHHQYTTSATHIPGTAVSSMSCSQPLYQQLHNLDAQMGQLHIGETEEAYSSVTKRSVIRVEEITDPVGNGGISSSAHVESHFKVLERSDVPRSDSNQAVNVSTLESEADGKEEIGVREDQTVLDKDIKHISDSPITPTSQTTYSGVVTVRDRAGAEPCDVGLAPHELICSDEVSSSDSLTGTEILPILGSQRVAVLHNVADLTTLKLS